MAFCRARIAEPPFGAFTIFIINIAANTSAMTAPAGAIQNQSCMYPPFFLYEPEA
jgi:hypothetical protein